MSNKQEPRRSLFDNVNRVVVIVGGVTALLISIAKLRFFQRLVGVIAASVFVFVFIIGRELWRKGEIHRKITPPGKPIKDSLKYLFKESPCLLVSGIMLSVVFLTSFLLFLFPEFLENNPTIQSRLASLGVATPITTITLSPTPTDTLMPTPMPTMTSALTVTATPTPTSTPTLTPPSAAPEETPQLISIEQRFPAPGGLTEGITWDGTYLWLADNSGTIFQVDILGRTLGAFESPEVTPQGLAWDGSSLWVFTTNYGFIYQFQIEGQETKTTSSFESPARVFGGDITNDMAWDGENLWYANQYNVYRLDTSGEIASSFAFPKNVMGLDWDGSNLWLAYNDFPSNSTLVVVDAEGNTLDTFPSPVFKIKGLAWGDGYLWAVGRDSLGGESVIYKLDVSLARDAVARSSDTTWQAQVLSVRKSFALEDTRIGEYGVPQPFQYYADEDRTFIIVELGLKSQVMGAALYTEDISVMDDQGHAYSPAGIRKSVAPMPDEFAIGTLAGIITMSHLEPPVLTFEYEIKRVTDSSTSTTQGEMPITASDGEWPGLVLVWLIPADASGLQLTVPGALAIKLEE